MASTKSNELSDFRSGSTDLLHINAAHALQFISIVTKFRTSLVNLKLCAGDVWFNRGWLSLGSFLSKYCFELCSSDQALRNFLREYLFVTFWQVF